MSDEKHLTHDQRMNVDPDALYVRPGVTRSEELHVESHTRYGLVWVFLAVFTLIEYFWAHIFANAFAVLLIGLLVWAIIKASAVGWYFMHLKFEGKWVYGMLIPAGILAIILTHRRAFLPDVGDAAGHRGEPRRGRIGGGLADRSGHGPPGDRTGVLSQALFRVFGSCRRSGGGPP